MNKSESLPISAYLRPPPDDERLIEDITWTLDMGSLLTKKTAAQSSLTSTAAADHGSQVNLTSIHNYIVALADKTDQHHEHTATVMILMIILIIVAMAYITYKYVSKKFLSAVEARIQRNIDV